MCESVARVLVSNPHPNVVCPTDATIRAERASSQFIQLTAVVPHSLISYRVTVAAAGAVRRAAMEIIFIVGRWMFQTEA